jgi:predicted MFS family arabinose efflux permease
MRIHELHPQRKAVREPGLVRAGLRYVWSSQALRVPLVVMLLVYLFTFNFSVVIPLHAYRTYGGGPIEIGWLYAALGLGAFLGAIAMANRQTEPTLRRLAGFSATFGVLLGVAGLAPRFMLALIAMVPVGYASMLFAITANSTLQRFTRADMRGRVMALYTTIFLGSTAIGGPITGWVAEHWGVPATFVASGGVALAAGLFALRAQETAAAPAEVPTADTAARSS